MTYPEDWPRCECGLPVLDGHLTCGRVECDEGAARRRREESWPVDPEHYDERGM